MGYTRTGQLVNFQSAGEAPIRSLKVYFSPKQEGTGDPSPNNVRSISGVQGVTVTQAGRNILSPINDSDGYYSAFVPAGTVVTASSDAYSQGSVTVAYYDADKQRIDYWTLISASNNRVARKITVLRDAYYWKFTSGSANEMLIFGTSDLAYQAPSGTTYPVTFPAVGKNLLSSGNFNEEAALFGRTAANSAADGTLSLSAGTYTVSCSETVDIITVTNENSQQLVLSQNVTSATFTLTDTTAIGILIYKTNATAEQMQSYNYQLELGDTATEYEPFNNTIYGGYVDLVSGEVVENTNSNTLNGTDDNTSSNYTTYANYVPGNDGDTFGAGRRFTKKVDDALTTIYCDSLPIYYDYSSTDFPYLWVTENSGKIYYMVIMGKLSEHPEITSSGDAATYTTNWLKTHPVTVRWKTTPTEYQLAPTELKTYLGSNNIWSNADRVEIEYDIQETPDIREVKRKIITGVPHIATASGAIASFNTDVVGPVKSAKIEFAPIQAGSGDASPSNVRSISGWNQIRLLHPTKNLFNKFATLQEPNNTTQAATTKRIFQPWTYHIGGSFSNYYTPTNEYVSYFEMNDNEITICSTNGYGVGFPIPVESGCSYYLSANSTGTRNRGIDIAQYTADGTFVGPASFNNKINTIYTAPENVTMIVLIVRSQTTIGSNDTATFTDIQFEKATSTTQYESITNLLINWENDYGTLYGGYVDLISGVLTVTQGIVTMDGTGSTNEGKSFYGKAGTTKNIQFYTYLNDLNYYHPSETGNRPDGICNMAHTITRDEATSQDFKMPTGIDVGYETFINPTNNNYTKRITFPLDTEINTLAKANNWLADLYTNGTPLQFTYTFGTPLTYQLDPVDIVTLKGVNNVWSDAGNVEVKYWKH